MLAAGDEEMNARALKADRLVVHDPRSDKVKVSSSA